MIILQKKKILLCIGLVTASLLLAGTYRGISDLKTVPTVSLPVSNKVIVLDARTSEYLMRERKVVAVLQKLKQI